MNDQIHFIIDMLETLDRTPLPKRESSVTELQLLSNIGRIKSKAEKAGLPNVVEIIDRYYPPTTILVEPVIDSIARLTACITDAFDLTPKEMRKTVFAEYTKAEEYGEGMGYAPKTEVETFCEKIEPGILAVL